VDQAGHFDANPLANDAYGQFFAFAFENNPPDFSVQA